MQCCCTTRTVENQIILWTFQGCEKFWEKVLKALHRTTRIIWILCFSLSKLVAEINFWQVIPLGFCFWSPISSRVWRFSAFLWTIMIGIIHLFGVIGKIRVVSSVWSFFLPEKKRLERLKKCKKRRQMLDEFADTSIQFALLYGFKLDSRNFEI